MMNMYNVGRVPPGYPINDSPATSGRSLGYGANIMDRLPIPRTVGEALIFIPAATVAVGLIVYLYINMKKKDNFAAKDEIIVNGVSLTPEEHEVFIRYFKLLTTDIDDLTKKDVTDWLDNYHSMARGCMLDWIEQAEEYREHTCLEETTSKSGGVCRGHRHGEHVCHLNKAHKGHHECVCNYEW